MSQVWSGLTYKILLTKYEPTSPVMHELSKTDLTINYNEKQNSILLFSSRQPSFHSLIEFLFFYQRINYRSTMDHFLVVIAISTKHWIMT